MQHLVHLHHLLYVASGAHHATCCRGARLGLR